jgi:hypothetical protein
MKTKLQKLNDIDFMLTVVAILVGGFSFILFVAFALYADKAIYPFFWIMVGCGISLIVWKPIREILIVKYEKDEKE